MSKASTKNYDNAQEKYNQLVNQYSGADNYKNQYSEAKKIANENAKQTQSQKTQAYINQGMNPTKAAALASKEASNEANQETNSLVNNLYNANQDVINQQSSNLENAKNKDNVENQNKGRTWSTVGGILQGTGQMASAVSDENAKNIKEDFDFYTELLRGEK